MAFTVYRAGAEIQVNTTAEGDQTRPSVTTLNDGGWIVAWRDSDANGTGVYMQRFNAQGVKQAGEIQVNTATASDQYPPVTAALSDGGWVVAWQSIADYRVHLQQYDSDGNPVGSETSVSGSRPVYPNYDALGLVGLPDGGWLVTWSSSTGTTKDIMQQRFGSNGTELGAAVTVNTVTATQEDYSTVTALKGPSGGWVVAWSSAVRNDPAADVFIQLFDADGNKVGGNIRVGPVDSLEQNRPRVAALSDGGFVVTWHSKTEANGYDVYQQRYDSNGIAVGENGLVSKTTAGWQDEPSVTGLSDGGWVVTWNSGSDVFQRHYDSSGRTTGPDLVVPAWLGSQLNYHSNVSALAQDGWVVTWQNEWQDNGTSAGIAQRAFTPTGGNVLTNAYEITIGTDGDETLRVEHGGLIGDVVVGNGGLDTLEMVDRVGADFGNDRSVWCAQPLRHRASDRNCR